MSKKEKRFSKVGILIVASMVIALVICLAVALPSGFGGGHEKLDDDGQPGLSDVMEKGSPIIIFDKRSESKAMLAAFEKDEIESVHFVTSDDEGNASEDKDDVVDAYRALKNIMIGEETAVPKGGTTYTVVFTLADGTECGYEFAMSEEDGFEAVNLGEKWYKEAGFSDLLKVLQDM